MGLSGGNVVGVGFSGGDEDLVRGGKMGVGIWNGRHMLEFR